MRGDGNMLLTKDLIKYRTRDGKVFPAFLPEDMVKARDLAATMIDLGASLGSVTIEEYENALHEEADPTLPYFKGLLKVFLGNSIGDEPVDISSQRLKYLELSQNIREECKGNLAAFRSKMSLRTGLAFEELTKALYGDLAVFSTLQIPPNLNVSNLLGSYNLALLKGVVLTANSLFLEWTSDLASTRFLLRAAKFHRLVLESIEVSNAVSRLKVSGPLSLSEQNISYGIKLAHFIGTIVKLKKWKLQADIKLNSKELKLEVISDSVFFGVSESPDAYVPKEYEILLGNHEIKGERISIVHNTEIIPMGKEMIFPDFCISTQKGSFYLELAHKWHQGCIASRLSQPKLLKEMRLVLAIDKSLFKNDKIREHIEFAKKNEVPMLEFRDFPTVKAISELIANFPFIVNLKDSSFSSESSMGLRAPTRSRRAIGGIKETKYNASTTNQRGEIYDIC